MEVKHGRIKVESIVDIYLFRDIYDIYQKTDGNYIEFLFNHTEHIEGTIQDGEEVITMDVIEDDYKVHPNTTLDHVLSDIPSNYTWLKELTII